MSIVKNSFKNYWHNGLSLYSAALSFYTIFALGPLFLSIVVLGSIFSEGVRTQIESLLVPVFGDKAHQLLDFMQSYSFPAEGVISTVVGLVFFFYAAIRMFGVLQSALVKIWEEKSPTGFSKQVVSFILMVACLGVVLTVLLIQVASPVSNTYFSAIIGFLTLFVLLTVVYNILLQEDLTWTEVFTAAFITSVFFAVGQTVINILLRNISVYSISSAVIALLLLTYYVWQVILIGSQVAKEYIEAYNI